MNFFIEVTKFFIYSILIVLVSKYILVKVLRKIGELLELKSKIVGNIAGIATSIPELLTVSFSAVTGLIATSTYNIISSNIINLIQYSATIILNKNHKVLKNKAIKIDLILVILTIIIPIIMIFIKIKNDFILIPIFIIILFFFNKITNNAHKVYMNQKRYNRIRDSDTKDVHNKNIEIVERSSPKTTFSVFMQVIILLIVGIVLYIIGNLLSAVLENLCIRFKIPEIIVGILLGIITSIPELITFLESQKHHEDDNEGVVEATSNLLTSNMVNLFVIQSVGIIVYFSFNQ